MREQKITFGEMLAAGVRALLVYCADYRCAHVVRISADRWPDHIRLSDLEPAFVCQACDRGADIRAGFRLGNSVKGPPGVKRGQLRGHQFFDDLPEVRCQRAIVISKHLIKGPLGLVRRLPSGLFALGGFGLVLLHFGLKISHHSTTPRNTHNLR
jgi:hypothetical protein